MSNFFGTYVLFIKENIQKYKGNFQKKLKHVFLFLYIFLNTNVEILKLKKYGSFDEQIFVMKLKFDGEICSVVKISGVK